MSLGRLTYTQHTVAWPNLPLHDRDRISDEIGISREGGGEFRFTFRTFSDGQQALRIEVFTDGLLAFLDPRIQRVIRLLPRPSGENDVGPEGLIEMLRVVAGATPSHYHIRGLIERDDLTAAEKDELQREYEAAKKLDEQ